MNIEHYKKELKKQLALVGISDILNELMAKVDSKASFFNEIILLQIKHRELEKSKRIHIIDNEEYTLQLSRIYTSTLGLIDRLRANDIIGVKSDAKINSAQGGSTVIPKSVFLSTPISALNDEHEFKLIKSISLEIQEVLRYQLDCNIIYYAGNTISELGDFHTPEASILQDFKAIHTCEKFIMVYPRKYATSALVEVGYAMNLKKDIVIITTHRDELPFLLSKADKVYENIRIFEKVDIATIPTFLPTIFTLE